MTGTDICKPHSGKKQDEVCDVTREKDIRGSKTYQHDPPAGQPLSTQGFEMNALLALFLLAALLSIAMAQYWGGYRGGRVGGFRGGFPRWGGGWGGRYGGWGGRFGYFGDDWDDFGWD